MLKNTKRKNTQKGITLIALVITIIVLLILAGISISMLTGNNGVLTQTGNAKTQTSHGQIYEAMQLEAQSYLTEKNAGGYEGTLIEYLNRDESKPIVNSDGIINVKNLIGTSLEVGNGTSIASGDVYVLQETNKESANTNQYKEIAKVATLANVKIAETSNTEVKYEVVYYGKTESKNATLGFIYSGASSVSDDILEYGYLFRWDDDGELSIRDTGYSYYSCPISKTKNGTIIYLFSKNELQLTNISLVIPRYLKGKKVTVIPQYMLTWISDLKKVKIPDTVNTLEAYGMFNNSLKEVQIPTSVSKIEAGNFYLSSLDTIYYEGTEDQWKAIDIDSRSNQALTSANIIYNYKGNDIVEGAEETTKIMYTSYARNILNNLSEDEIKELFYEGEKYWKTREYDYDYPGQEITKQLIAEKYGYDSYENLLENICLNEKWKGEYNSLEELLIGWRYVKPEGYFGE